MATIEKKSFWQQYGSLILILGGIIVGALIGAFAPTVGTTIKPIGDIFLNLLFTIVVPLVFVSIASAVGSMANMKRLGGDALGNGAGSGIHGDLAGGDDQVAEGVALGIGADGAGSVLGFNNSHGWILLFRNLLIGIAVRETAVRPVPFSWRPWPSPASPCPPRSG